MSVEATTKPLAGMWKPRPVKEIYYGPKTVEKYLLSLMPNDNSKAFIITGSSLANKTPLVKNLESLLGSKHHAGTFSKIGQHAPIAQLDEATEMVKKDPSIDTIISLGGGSPIDSAKAISYRVNEASSSADKYLFHITIPTTLSAAECTQLAGYTNEEGVKTGLNDPRIAVNIILYDPAYAAHTPKRLWLSTGIRALDHAIETLYHPFATEMPAKMNAIAAIVQLMQNLPKAKESHPDDEDVSTRLFLAAYQSLGFLGLNFKGGLGLSHALGYALGSPYQIPHGETSCMTLGHVVKLKASMSKEDAEQIARVLPYLGETGSGDAVKDANRVGDKILELVEALGLKQGLNDRGVGKDQIDIITQRATGGQKEGKLHDNVKGLVQNLYY